MECELVVVGAGPAGMAAAYSAGRLGLRTVVLDSEPTPGGQYYRHPSQVRPPSTVASFLHYVRRSTLVTYMPETVAWHLEPGFKVYIERPSGPQVLTSRCVILATGAWERPVPFPGWDLPGVVTAGAVQALLKGYGVIAGEPLVLAGGGFVLTVARQVLTSGGKLAAVVLTGSSPLVSGAWLMLRRPSVLGELTATLGLLARHKVPVYTGWLVREAVGTRTLREVVLVRHDRAMSPIPGSATRLRARVLGVGYGFVSSTQLARVAGCQLTWDGLHCQWLPKVNADLETTVKGLFVAGEAAGSAGAHVAELEGELAALCAFERLRGTDSALAERRNKLQAKREVARRWAAQIQRLSALRPGIFGLASRDTVVCRCEKVSWGEVIDALSEYPPDLTALKAATRIGMGPCQGRFCEPSLIPMVAQQAGVDPGMVEPFSVRPPVEPIEVGRLALLDRQ